MIARVRKSMDENQKGFTLIELLVVVIIIGILAAIAIPMFLSQREKAWEKQVVSDMKNAITAAEALATSDNGSYGTTPVTLDNDSEAGNALFDNGARSTDGVKILFTPADLSYTMTGEHDKLDDKEWSYSSDVGVIVNPSDE